MKYSDFEHVISSKRMRRYLNACGGDKRRAQLQYRLNLRLSQEMFTIISFYEVALRNAIDQIMAGAFGADWIRDCIQPGGVFDDTMFSGTTHIINKAYNELKIKGKYSSSKMLSAMEFGVWKYMFSSTQYRATGRILLRVFPNKPKSSVDMQYNNLFFFNELDAVNRLRNRIAHHEPICFMQDLETISTLYLKKCYARIVLLFCWMGIDTKSLLYGLDHIPQLTERIDELSHEIGRE